jgi:hypothetical protein
MEVIILIIVLVIVASLLADYKPLNKRIEESDNDPNNSVKSNLWLKAHPEWKGRN